MSLADELLADLEEGGEDLERDQHINNYVTEVEDVTMDISALKTFSVRNVAKLLDSDEVGHTKNFKN